MEPRGPRDRRCRLVAPGRCRHARRCASTAASWPVDTGCNTGSGGYTVAGTDITFGPIALTRRACLDEASAGVEQAMLTVLTGTVA